MARQVVDIGVEGNDGTGDSIRESFRKVNSNFQEIYAVVGRGGQITWTSLADTPDDLEPYKGNGEAAYIPVVAQDGSSIEIRQLVSNSAESGSTEEDTISFVVTQDGKLILKTENARLEQDTTPALGGPLNAAGSVIANVSTTQEALATLNSLHNLSLTLDDVVIDKKFADSNYYVRQLPGERVNLESEPTDTTEYLKAITANNNGFAESPNHGLTGASTGAGYIYTTTGVPFEYTYTDSTSGGATATTSPVQLSIGQTVYIRVRNENQIEFYLTQSDAFITDEVLREQRRLKLDGTSATGVHTIQNPYYDETLQGNWLFNEALPRNSVVRRQGDNMEGVLLLGDHPGNLAGAGTPTGPDDLQAASKLYVDSQSTESSTNLFVSTQGSDNQTLVPPGRQGRSLFYAYRTLSAAARAAEAIQIASPYEPGPFMQDIVYTETAEGNSVVDSQVTSASVSGAEAGDIGVKSLVDVNKNFIIEEVIAWIDQNIANEAVTPVGSTGEEVRWRTVTYDRTILEAELTRVIDANTLDHLAGENSNQLSRRVGLEYFSQLDLKARAGLTQGVFDLAIGRARVVTGNVLLNDPNTSFAALQDTFDQVFLEEVPLENDISSINNNFTLIQEVIRQGVFSAPTEILGRSYVIEFTNGTRNFVDQGDPQNRDLRVGKLIRGKTSGAMGRIVSYTAGIDTSTGDDTVLLELVTPIEFIRGEKLEFGNATKERNISIRVESGTYYEDFPIRVPANTSFVGDESRRCIIKPRSKASNSMWADVYFYRDLEFDDLRGDSESVTGVPDSNLPVNGLPYVNPVSGEQNGYFGRHYLYNPTSAKNIDDGGIITVENPGGFEDSATLLEENEGFVLEETLAWINERANRSTPPSGFEFTYTQDIENTFSRVIRSAVQSVVDDLRQGGRTSTLNVQSETFYELPENLKDAANAAFGYVRSIWEDVLQNILFTRGSEIDSFVDADAPDQYINTDLTTDLAVYDPDANTGVMIDLVLTLQFAFNSEFNPAKPAEQIDCFMLNDASMVRGVTVQGHGGFTAVLDPEGQILTKEPFISNVLTFSKGINRQAFRGGVFIDAFCANTPLSVVEVLDGGFRLVVEAPQGSALALRKPLTPAPFYIDGVRYQVNNIVGHDPEANPPTAELILDPYSGVRDTNGNYQGFQESLNGGFDITLQTPGSRSVRVNDVTMINDLGYGVVAANGALCEIGSTYSFYCHASCYSLNGSEIRATASSSTYGNNGLVAEGSDPNEVPDDVVLVKDVNQAALSFVSETTLYLNNNIQVVAGDTVTQVGASGTGTVVLPTNARQVYLKDVDGTFTLTGEIEVNGTAVSGVVPSRIDAEAYSNPATRLAIHFFETESVPNGRGDITYYHNDGGSPAGTISRYQVTTIDELTGIVVDGHIIEDNRYTYSPVSRGPEETVGTSAVLLIRKTQENGGTYYVEVYDGQNGESYKVGDTFDISGADLNGNSPANDVTITVTEVAISESNAAGDNTGPITNMSISGTPNIVPGLTPQRNGQVYRANFSTNNDEFNPEGLLDDVPYGKPLMMRESRSFIFDDVRDTERLTIRPSTAINFQEQPEFTYRAISFARSNSVGEDLRTNETIAGTDISFDFVVLSVNNSNKDLTGSSITDLGNVTNSSTTLGSTTGDTTIAIDTISDRIDIFRLNNNFLTNSSVRPPFTDNQGITLDYTNQLPMIFTWQGKKHYAFNYREVFVDGTDYQVQTDFDSTAHSFALVDILEVDGNILTLSGPATFSRLNSNLDQVIVRQVNTGAEGKIKVSGEETTTMKIFDISGTFNTSDVLEISTDNGTSYQPLEDTSNNAVYPVDVFVRDTNLTDQATGIAEPLSTVQNDIVKLRAAIQDGSPAVITVRISTCRATGHDFKDIGTGSYNQTNFPSAVLGDPINTPNSEQQVQERDRGRVFYESTDQDGLYRVGRFLTVDQGTGTVNIAASIALSDVDGIGFRRGVVVSEFSTDTAMSDNAIDAVPTESAVRGYINRRLGFDQSGNAVTNPLGPSVLTANGAVQMTANLSAGGFTITNLAPVNLETTDASSAVPKQYVDTRAEAYNKLEDQRDVELQTAGPNQFIGLSGVKTIYIETGTVSGSTFALDQVLTNQNGTADYGTIVGVRSAADSTFGNVLIVNFLPGSDTFSKVDPLVATPPLIYHKTQGTTTTNGSGGVKNGPFFEVISLDEQTGNASDITLTVSRPKNSDTNGSYSDIPAGYYNLQIKPGVVVNSDISASAAIAQSKLNLQAADTFTGSLPSSANQSTLGLAKFDSANFTSTFGWIQVKDNGISFSKVQQIPTNSVVGRSNSGTGNASAIAFSTVVDSGQGLQLTDFPYTDINGVESSNFSNPGVLTRVGTDDFTVVPITTTGVGNSFVKTSSSGRIVANDLSLGQNNSSVVLRPTGQGNTGLEILTLNGGTILTSNGSVSPTVNIPGSVDIGATGVSESTIQGISTSAGDSWVASRWARHSFIEAISEGGTASTGIAIGQGSGKASTGEVSIITRNTGNNTSPAPFIFSSAGVRPDINNLYDIGTSSLRYRDIWVRNVNSSGTLGTTGNVSIGGTLTVTGNTSLNSNLTVSNNLTVLGLATVAGLTNNGNTVLGGGLADSISVNGSIVTNVLGRSNLTGDDNNGLDIGSDSRRWSTMYANTFNGTLCEVNCADLAENYLGDAEYEIGTVLIFGGEEEVTTTAEKDDHRAAGVVSGHPGYLMNAELEGDHVVALALQGRVPCKVIGKVNKGDIIVTSGVSGYGCVNNRPFAGTIIGKAVGVKDTVEKGFVEVVIGRT